MKLLLQKPQQAQDTQYTCRRCQHRDAASLLWSWSRVMSTLFISAMVASPHITVPREASLPSASTESSDPAHCSVESFSLHAASEDSGNPEEGVKPEAWICSRQAVLFWVKAHPARYSLGTGRRGFSSCFVRHDEDGGRGEVGGGRTERSYTILRPIYVH